MTQSACVTLKGIKGSYFEVHVHISFKFPVRSFKIAENMSSQLDGDWYSELGSSMNLKTKSDGTLTGTYDSTVGDAKSRYPLAGRYDTLTDRRSLGWTVTWVNEIHHTSMSTTCWSAQYQIKPENQQPQILATWILTVQTTPGEDWNSTNLGFDVFTKNPPTLVQSTKAKQQGRISHPKEAASA